MDVRVSKFEANKEIYDKYYPKIVEYIKWYEYTDNSVIYKYLNTTYDNRLLFIKVVADVHKDVQEYKRRLWDQEIDIIEDFNVSSMDDVALAIRLTEYIMAEDMAIELCKRVDRHAVNMYGYPFMREVICIKAVHCIDDRFEIRVYSIRNNYAIARFSMEYRYPTHDAEHEFLEQFYKMFGDNSMNPYDRDPMEFMNRCYGYMYYRINEFLMNHIYTKYIRYKNIRRTDIERLTFNTIISLVDKSVDEHKELLLGELVQDVIKVLCDNEFITEREEEIETEQVKTEEINKYKDSYGHHNTDYPIKYNNDKVFSWKEFVYSKYDSNYRENFLDFHTTAIRRITSNTKSLFSFRRATYVYYRMTIMVRYKNNPLNKDHEEYERLAKRYHKNIIQTASDTLTNYNDFVQSNLDPKSLLIKKPKIVIDNNRIGLEIDIIASKYKHDYFRGSTECNIESDIEYHEALMNINDRLSKRRKEDGVDY